MQQFVPIQINQLQAKLIASLANYVSSKVSCQQLENNLLSSATFF